MNIGIWMESTHQTLVGMLRDCRIENFFIDCERRKLYIEHHQDFEKYWSRFSDFNIKLIRNGSKSRVSFCYRGWEIEGNVLLNSKH